MSSGFYFPIKVKRKVELGKRRSIGVTVVSSENDGGVIDVSPQASSSEKTMNIEVMPYRYVSKWDLAAQMNLSLGSFVYRVSSNTLGKPGLN